MKKSYLFLQGAHGPFLKELGHRLEALGARVLRVNFNGGDWIDWNGANTVNFTGTQVEWRTYVADLFKQHNITDLVLFGDCRSLHQIAIEQTPAFGIRVHTFEEGYIRPCWITLEQGGVNGNSQLFDNLPDLISQEDSEPEELSSRKVGPSMRWIVFYCLRYYLFKSLWFPRFRYYVRHRPYRPHQELLLWLGNLLHMPLLYKRSCERRKTLLQSGNPFYLVCLQLDSDAQLRVHSNYLSMSNFINDVLRSFAAYAPPESYLVFKKHPFDPGAIPYETLVRLEAYSLGIRERVLFLHSGNLPELIRESQGVVLMNSTVGTSALHHEKPTIALGRAIYNIPGLTWQGGLEHFWTEAEPPDQQLYEKFRSCLLQQVLINGGFHSPIGRRLALEGSLPRLLQDLQQEQLSDPVEKVIPLRRPIGKNKRRSA